ncbi:MAG: hypothetical protein KGL39_08770 [Patescibacteria group bacterium]|nr:hypothetical protein [Patescibacteria group bacterium]
MAENELVRVGADPEVFVKHLPSRTVLPVCGLIGGTKEEPLKFNGLLKRTAEEGDYAYQEDGCAFEFNIPATTSADKFAQNMQAAWISVKELLGKLNLDPQIRPSFSFKSAQLGDPRAMSIGCSPDKTAYGENGPQTRHPLNIHEFGTQRFAGGHLHLGYNKAVPPHVMVRFMDVLIGLPSLKWDKQGARRQYYGLPGLYREKPYGVEYRSLSNFWLKGCGGRGTFLVYLSGALFDLGITAQNRPEVLANAYKMIPWDDVKDAITTENVNLASEIFQYSTSVAKLPSRYAHDLWRISPEGKVA